MNIHQENFTRDELVEFKFSVLWREYGIRDYYGRVVACM